ncbi:MAG TPA: hypothetical protein VNF26_06135 [Candidatus Baltobacterales bacterium]|nr:hypothetical protein [Candidatus Baltobacterales bacterium]
MAHPVINDFLPSDAGGTGVPCARYISMFARNSITREANALGAEQPLPLTIKAQASHMYRISFCLSTRHGNFTAFSHRRLTSPAQP